MFLDDKMKDIKMIRNYLTLLESIQTDFVILPSIDEQCEDFIEYIMDLIEKENHRVTKKLNLLESEVK